MSLLEIFLLAIVQGLTEFLPVSSSGHLVVANAVLEALGKEPTQDLIEVSIVLHLGTLAAVLVYYWRQIVQLLGVDRRVIPLLIIGTLPAAVVGIFMKKVLPEATSGSILDNVLLAGFMFPVTAAILWWSERRSSTAEGATALPSEQTYQTMSWKSALAIGAAQAFAILPGISRSGSTIAAGLGAGLQRESAATFAFLLAIPAIAGAGVLEGLDVLKEGTTGTPILLLSAGFVVSFLVGLAALALLIRVVRNGRLSRFAFYLVPLGIAVVAWRMVG